MKPAAVGGGEGRARSGFCSRELCGVTLTLPHPSPQSEPSCRVIFSAWQQGWPCPLQQDVIPLWMEAAVGDRERPFLL